MTEEALESILAAGIAVILIVLLIAIAYLVFYFIGVAKLYKKAGKPGWAVIVPFYNTYVLVEMVGLKWYWFLLSCASLIVGIFVDSGILLTVANIVSLVGNINIYYNLTKKMGKEPVWTVLLVLFSGILLPILGYGKDEWHADALVTENGLVDNIMAKSNGGQTASAPQQEPSNSSNPTDENNNTNNNV